ncbi:MAG: ThuA domain-containing protein [Clostridia bacterium]|nr:ThuA domain-containing protein [Clostridia bacterium]
MKVLLICDDIWHPADVIERGLAAMNPEEMEFDLVKTAKDILSPAFVSRYDVLVNCAGNSINAANSHPWFEEGVTEFGPEAFREYVLNGGGMVVIHSGLTIGGPRAPVPAYTDVAGAYFVSHPPREMTHVRVTRENEITRGVEDFSERDEHYQIVMTAEDVQPFLQTSSEHGGVTVSGYTRLFGKGRVAALTPGHTLAVWENPNFQKLVKNSIRWCALGSGK